MPKGYYTRAVREVIIPIGPSTAYIPLTKGYLCLIDRDDVGLVAAWNWYAFECKNMPLPYVVRIGRDATHKRVPIRMHRVITATPDHLVVDHRNHNTLDNRRCNLLVCTQAVNMQNIRLDAVNNYGGGTRVSMYWHTRDRRFRVRVLVGGKDFQVGSFKEESLAITARDEAIIKYS